jgi:superfamily II DNA or RNA helicase
MPQPKPFQSAAIAAACSRFRAREGSKRFLVADEVGLGKTVVAQQIIQRLAGTKHRAPLIVYYITNGQRVAHQNRDRLVEFSDPEVQKAAITVAILDRDAAARGQATFASEGVPALRLARW